MKYTPKFQIGNIYNHDLTEQEVRVIGYEIIGSAITSYIVATSVIGERKYCYAEQLIEKPDERPIGFLINK